MTNAMKVLLQMQSGFLQLESTLLIQRLFCMKAKALSIRRFL
jgi:hypothetical protein